MSRLNPIKHDSISTRTKVVPRDPKTRMGYDINEGRIIDTTTKNEWDQASAALQGQPAGTKYYCYDYEPIEYSDPYFLTKLKLRLSHTFIKTKYGIDAISNDDETQFIVKDSLRGREINYAEWRMAEINLKNAERGAKLPSHHKVYIDDVMRHCFWIFYIEAKGVDGKTQLTPLIIAAEGNGWRLGYQSKVKRCLDINHNGIFTKSPLKYRKIELKSYATTVAISLRVGIFSCFAHKQTGKKLPIAVLPAFQMDLHDYATKIKRDLNNKTKKVEFIKEKFIEFLTILGLIIDDLQTLHSQNILHRDIKPHNIFLSFSEAGEPCVRIGDFDFAVQTQDGRYSGVIVGTPGFFAPELRPETVDDSPREFSIKTDIFALGKSIESLYYECFPDPFLKQLIDRIKVVDPNDRPDLPTIKRELISYIASKNTACGDAAPTLKK